jgi:hypothetical protein
MKKEILTRIPKKDLEETGSDKILGKLEDDDLKIWFLTQLMTVSQNLEWSIEAAKLVCPIFEKQYQDNNLCRLIIEDTTKLSQSRNQRGLSPSFEASLEHYLLKRTALELLDFIEKDYHFSLKRGDCAAKSANRAASIAVHSPGNATNHFRTGYLAYEGVTFAHGALVESRSSKEERDKAFKQLLDIGIKIYHSKVKESNLL